MENDAAKHHRKALDHVIQVAAEVVEYTKANNLLRQEVINAENEVAKAVQAKNSHYQVQKVGLNAEARITSQTMRLVEPTFNPMMNVGDAQVDMEQETIHYCGRSIALTKGQGIPNYVDMPSEQCNGIACMICATLDRKSVV